MTYNHIRLNPTIVGKAKTSGGGGNHSEQTTQNLNDNRINHANYLKNKSSQISQYWENKGKDSNIPVYLKIDPELVDLDFLRASFEFEVLAEQEDGYVLVLSKDVNFGKFIDKINKLGGQNGIQRGGKKVGSVYEILDDENRINSILKSLGLGGVGEISDAETYSVNVCVAVSTIIKMPDIAAFQKKKEKKGEVLAKQWRDQKINEYYNKIDEVRIQRENFLENIVSRNNGEIMGSHIEVKYMDLYDSFTCKIKINGVGLKDLLHNNPYIFEITPETKIVIPESPSVQDNTTPLGFEIIHPASDAPRVVIIDSGIQENHPYLSLAIETTLSKCYISTKTEDNIADEVEDGGHGTRVAGAVLYGDLIPREGTYELPCYIRNARIIDEEGLCREEPRQLYKKIIQDFSQNTEIKSKLYNSSINNKTPNNGLSPHMDDRSVMLDELSYQNDILFIQSMGNIEKETLEKFFQGGFNYPEHFLDPTSKITKPAHSLNALVVGSLSHSSYSDISKRVVATENFPSSFSRSGPGLWGVIKPDLVEFGGERLIDSSNTLSIGSESATELVRLSPPLTASDLIGTSFSTPKITHMLAKIQAAFPNNSTLLYRSLLISSASIPFDFNNKDRSISMVGYGLPKLENALFSNDYKVTLFADNVKEIIGGDIHVYQIPIPEQLINQAYDVQVDITLSYKARPRKTRRRLKQYLSTWVDWKVSYLGEDPNAFLTRSIAGYNDTGIDFDHDGGMKRFLGPRSRSHNTEFSRSKGTVQRDWTVVKSDQLRNKFCVGVVGHKGRDKTGKFPAYYSLVVSFEIVGQEIPIYTQIQTEIESQIESEVEIGFN